MRILLTGTTGKLGAFLAQQWASQHSLIPLTRAEVDLSQTDALRSFLAKQSFHAILNPAAISTPEACEAAPELARLVNSTAPRILAEACAEKNAHLIHFSTDYVLNGDIPGLKSESAKTGPNNIYGETKLAGEKAALQALPSTTITRVSWVFGSAGPGFLEKILSKIQADPTTLLEGVADKFSMPTCASEMAQALNLLLDHRPPGHFHLTQNAEQPVSWHTYAQEVARAAHNFGLTKSPLEVAPQKMANIPILRTNRPIHTAMTPQRLADELNLTMSDWKTALHNRVRELLA